MSEPISDEELARLMGEATPGPWESWVVDDDERWGVCRPEEVPGELGDGSALVSDSVYEEADAQLIALAPSLATEVLALRSRLAAAEDVVGAADDLAMRWAFRGQAAFADFFSDGMDKLADALGRYDSTPPTTTDHPPTSEGGAD